jgi:hypothetical protein
MEKRFQLFREGKVDLKHLHYKRYWKRKIPAFFASDETKKARGSTPGFFNSVKGDLT